MPKVQADFEVTKKFLDTLFFNLPEKAYFYIWSTPTKLTFWFDDFEKAVDKCKSMVSNGENVYIGVGLSDNINKKEELRCKREDVTGLVGVWADLDYLDTKAHGKTNLPPDENSALELLYTMPYEPSIVINSGHGLQAWWLFDKPLIFKDAKEKEHAKAVCEAWNMLLKKNAFDRKWDIDSVFDISRVLRLPGTLNMKVKSRPKLVRVLSESTSRYTLKHISEITESNGVDPKRIASKNKAQNSVVKGVNFTLDPKADPPFDKFVAMCDVEPKFKDSVDHARPKREFSDQSPSSYDFSIAVYCAMSGWSDQEIVNMLIYSRRKNKCDLKLRIDYYERTIRKARQKVEEEKAKNDIDDFVGIADSEEGEQMYDEMGELTNDKRKEMLASVSKLLNIEITRIVKYTSEPPQYALETTCGKALLGGVNGLIRQGQFKEFVAATTGRYITSMKRKEWDKIATILLQAVTEEDVGDESTNNGLIKAWLSKFIFDKPPTDDIEDGVESGRPFYHNGDLCIVGSVFVRWLKFSENEKMSSRNIGIMLRGFGAKPDKISAKINNIPTSRSIWRLPGNLETYTESAEVTVEHVKEAVEA